MNVVVTDSARLAGEADFPMLDLPKFGWQQFPKLTTEQAVEECWRADIIITVATPIDRTVIDKAFKLRLIAVAGDNTDHIDKEACAERGIEIVNIPGADPSNAAETDHICNTLVEKINGFIKAMESGEST